MGAESFWLNFTLHTYSHINIHKRDKVHNQIRKYIERYDRKSENIREREREEEKERNGPHENPFVYINEAAKILHSRCKINMLLRTRAAASVSVLLRLDRHHLFCSILHVFIFDLVLTL